MRKLLLGAVLAVVTSLAFASVALAQTATGSYTDPNPQVGDTCPQGFAAYGDISSPLTCISPQDQEAIANGTMTQADIPQVDVGATTTQAVSCDGFGSQYDAQQFFDQATAEQQATLDPDGNGYACDNGSITGPLNPTTTAPAATTAAPVATTPATTAAPATTAVAPSTTAALPDTGGPAILLPAGAMLVAGGLLAFGLRRRR